MLKLHLRDQQFQRRLTVTAFILYAVKHVFNLA